MNLRLIPALVAASLLSLAPAAAASLDGAYAGASSTAGGNGEACFGNAPASAVVSGGTVTISAVAYDGTQAPFAANLKPDGSFAVAREIKGASISYSGKVTARSLTATWKGPACWGTLDMSRR